MTPPEEGDGDPVPPVVPDEYCDAPELVFKVEGSLGGCNGGICHTPGTLYPPDLISDGVVDRLLDVTSTTTSCAGSKYIDPANIAISLMLTKLSAVPSCGIQMPFAQPPLDAAKLDCIRSWVAGVTAALQ